MSNANNVILRFESESTWGGSTASSTYSPLRFTSEELRQNTTSVTSNEIISDRQVADLVRVNVGSGGPVNYEMNIGTFDELLKAGIFASSNLGADSALASSEANLIYTARTSGLPASIAKASSGLGSATPGNWIKITGASNNNGFYKVLDTLGADSLDVHLDVTGETDSNSATVYELSSIVNGSAFSDSVSGTHNGNSFLLEKEYSDLSSEYERHVGTVVNGWTINATLGEILTGSFDFVSKTCTSQTTSAATSTSSDTNEILNPVDHIETIIHGHQGTENAAGTAAKDFKAIGFSVSVNNNLRSNSELGTLGAIAVGLGTINVEGTLRAYFTSKTIADEFLNHTTTSLSVILENTAGDAYVIDIPAVKFTSGQRVAGGQNQDVIMDLSFTAFKDSGLDSSAAKNTIGIHKFTA